MNTNASLNIEPSLSCHDKQGRLLEDRRKELVAALHERMRAVRGERRRYALEGGLGEGGVSEVGVQEDIEQLALTQIREILELIDESITRMKTGAYGRCSSCAEEIASARLRAVPFTVRCQECEEQAGLRTIGPRQCAPFPPG